MLFKLKQQVLHPLSILLVAASSQSEQQLLDCNSCNTSRYGLVMSLQLLASQELRNYWLLINLRSR